MPLEEGSVRLFSSADDDTGRGGHIIFYYDNTSCPLISFDQGLASFIIDGRFAGEFTQRRPVQRYRRKCSPANGTDRSTV